MLTERGMTWVGEVMGACQKLGAAGTVAGSALRVGVDDHFVGALSGVMIFASSERSVGHRYAPMGAGSSARGGFSFSCS
jgi:hypothetical protein